MKTHRIAVIAGDGIGQEVMPEGLRVLQAVARRFGIGLQFDHFDFACWDYYRQHGRMLPEDWKQQIGTHDAIYFGAVGWPDKIPDHISLWESLLLFRREFDQYINLRPARLMPGVTAPVVRRDGSPRQPGEIDMLIVRENTEGEYSSIGGRMFEGTEREMVMQETVMTRLGVDRVLRFAFELAQSRPRRHLTSATKSNGIAITMPYWDERVALMARQYPDGDIEVSWMPADRLPGAVAGLLPVVPPGRTSHQAAPAPEVLDPRERNAVRLPAGGSTAHAIRSLLFRERTTTGSVRFLLGAPGAGSRAMSAVGWFDVVDDGRYLFVEGADIRVAPGTTEGLRDELSSRLHASRAAHRARAGQPQQRHGCSSGWCNGAGPAPNRAGRRTAGRTPAPGYAPAGCRQPPHRHRPGAGKRRNGVR